MDVPAWVWLATIGGLAVLMAVDLFIVDRKPHEVGVGEATRWVAFYVFCAVLFGLVVWYFAGGGFAFEYFAGYITEYSLSVDNLFIFVIIMTTFGVPVIHQHRVLLVGVVLALVMRGMFIAAGAALISRFSWVFYLFGALLIYLGWQQVRHSSSSDDEEYRENIALRLLRKLVPVTAEYHGTRLTTKLHGKRWVTPMLVVMFAIGTTDLIFALDSIPAIFGLTQEAFLVFTANAFALMGLRQLYFLIGGLLSRLVYLHIGLGVVLGFIGIKLMLEALHDNGLPVVGLPAEAAPAVNIQLSLGVIIGVLIVTTVASLLKVRRNPAAAQQADKKPAEQAAKNAG